MTHKGKHNDFVCQAREAKTRIGIKFWCYECKRYVLQDSIHKLRFNEKL